MSKDKSPQEQEPVVAALADIAGAIREHGDVLGTADECHAQLRFELAREFMAALVIRGELIDWSTNDGGDNRAIARRALKLADAFIEEAKSDGE